jgi:hypothetical protein
MSGCWALASAKTELTSLFPPTSASAMPRVPRGDAGGGLETGGSCPNGE